LFTTVSRKIRRTGAAARKVARKSSSGAKGIGNFEDAGFGVLAIRFRRFVFLYALVQLPGGTIDLPGRDQSFKLISNREGLLKRFPARPANRYQRWLLASSDPSERLADTDRTVDSADFRKWKAAERAFTIFPDRSQALLDSSCAIILQANA